jgi:hypothetical protein
MARHDQTGADGTFVIRFLPLPGMALECSFVVGERETPRFMVGSGDEPVTLTVR